jgi:hypothetical protein
MSQYFKDKILYFKPLLILEEIAQSGIPRMDLDFPRSDFV